MSVATVDTGDGERRCSGVGRSLEMAWGLGRSGVAPSQAPSFWELESLFAANGIPVYEIVAQA
jgi:hypothetical protein